MMKTVPDSLNVEEVHERLIAARDDLLVVYREYHPILDVSDRRTLDEARKKVVNIILGLELSGLAKGEVFSSELETLRELERANMVLAHYHQQLLFSVVRGAVSLQRRI